MVTGVNEHGHHVRVSNMSYSPGKDPTELGITPADPASDLKSRLTDARESTPHSRGGTKAEHLAAQAPLTEDERRALVMYATGDPDKPTVGTDAYTAPVINNGLRSGDSSHRDIPALDSAIAKGPGFPTRGGRPEGMVYRVVPATAVEHLKRGDTFADPAYTSTTFDPDELPREATKAAGGAPVRMRILVPKGYPGTFTGYGYDIERHGVSAATRQAEWLLPRGTEYRVLSRGKSEIVLEVVPKESAIERAVRTGIDNGA